MWDTIFTVLFFAYMGRIVVGAVWGILTMRATFWSTMNWDWKDAFIAGPAFWIGWAIGVGLRKLIPWVHKKIMFTFFDKGRTSGISEE